MSNIKVITVMLCFMQAMNLMTLFISIPDFSEPTNVLRFFWPGALALVCFIVGKATKPKA